MTSQVKNDIFIYNTLILNVRKENWGNGPPCLVPMSLRKKRRLEPNIFLIHGLEI